MSLCICKNSHPKLIIFQPLEALQMLVYLINFWKYFLEDILLFLLEIYPFYRTKWKSVTGQKYFTTGHLNSPLKKSLNLKF